jgi:phage-related minor tail protein
MLNIAQVIIAQVTIAQVTITHVIAQVGYTRLGWFSAENATNKNDRARFRSLIETRTVGGDTVGEGRVTPRRVAALAP